MTWRKAFDTGPEWFAWAALVASVALVVAGVIGEATFLGIVVVALAMATGLKIRKLKAGSIELEGGSDEPRQE